MKEDVRALLTQERVRCILRNQPGHLTFFFYERLKQLSLLVVHPEADLTPRKTTIARVWDLLKVIASPIDSWRKDERIARDWPLIEQALKELL